MALHLVSESKVADIDMATCIMASVAVTKDCRHISYAATRGNKQVVVHDMGVGEPFDGIAEGTPVFSPDGKRVAFVARVSAKWFVVLDGVRGKSYDRIIDVPVFSSDSKHLAYFAHVAGEGIKFVIDGTEKATHEDIGRGSLVFSPDSNHIAYGAKKGGRWGRWSVVCDGKGGNAYDAILEKSPLFSPDSRHLAYGAAKAGEWFVVVDDNEEKHYEGIGVGSLSFSDDSSRFAYAAFVRVRLSFWRRPLKSFVVIDAHEEKQYDVVDAPKINSDGQCLAYRAELDGRRFVVVNGTEGKKYDGILEGTPVISPIGHHVAYGARIGNKHFVVLDGQEGTRYDGIGERTLTFSPNGEKVAFMAGIGGKFLMVVDNKEQKPYDGIGTPPIFSSDGSSCAYGAYGATTGKHCFIVLNGEEGKRYDALVTIGGGTLVFDDPSTVHYLAIRGKEILAVTEAL